MFRPVSEDHLRGVTQGGHWLDLPYLWVKRAGIRGRNVDNGPLTRIGNQRIGLGGALGIKVYTAFTLSVTPCTGAVIVDKPGERPEGRGGSLKFAPSCILVNIQKLN